MSFARHFRYGQVWRLSIPDPYRLTKLSVLWHVSLSIQREFTRNFEEMDTANDEVQPLVQPAADAKSVQTPTVENHHNHNSKIRRRIVTADEESAATVNLLTKDNGVIESRDSTQLVTLPDSTKAWYDDDTPRIPDTTDVVMSGKQNKVLTRDGNDHDSDSDNGAVVKMDDSLKSREKTKISVIRSSLANSNLTLGELRQLGCSNEGFVTGTFTRIAVRYNQQGTLLSFRFDLL